MKVSSIILLVTFVLLVTAMFASNILLKKEYDKIDKSDIYWTYGKILEQPFKHLKIEGGNVTHIAFEPGNKPSVKVFKMWAGFDKKAVKAYVKNDTLFVKFPDNITDPNERRYMGWNTLVRIFSPQLLSVNGVNTNLGLFKMHQKNIDINMSGKSKFEIESYDNSLDSLHIIQRDSSEVVFEMSPDVKTMDPDSIEATNTKAPQITKEADLLTASNGMVASAPLVRKGWENMYVKAVDADVKGVSLLDLGHAQINALRLSITDTSAIILSGGSLAKFKK